MNGIHGRLLLVGLLLVILVAFQLIAAPAWPTERSAQWAAVNTLATIAIFLATLAGLIGLIYLYRGEQRAHEQMRLELGPYLRIDLAPDKPNGTFTPPLVDTRFDFDYAAFNPASPTEPVTLLSRWIGQTEVCLWIENQQTHSSGVAVDVVVDIELEVPLDPDGQSSGLQPMTVNFHYLEPGRRVRYRLASVTESIPYLVGEVVAVRYFDVTRRRLHFAHGSAAFEWLGTFLVNRRKVFHDEELYEHTTAET